MEWQQDRSPVNERNTELSDLRTVCGTGDLGLPEGQELRRLACEVLVGHL